MNCRRLSRLACWNIQKRAEGVLFRCLFYIPYAASNTKGGQAIDLSYARFATILNVLGRIVGYLAIVAGMTLLIGAINEGEFVILPLLLLGGGGAGIIALTSFLTDKLAQKILISKFT